MPGTFSVVGPGSEWDAAIDLLPFDARDVHMTSAYVSAIAEVGRPGGGTPLLATWANEQFHVCQALILRKIGDTEWFDLTAPGCGGAVSSHTFPTPAASAAFRDGLNDWCAHNHVVTEVCLFNPMLAGMQWPLLTKMPRATKEVIVLPLVVPIEELATKKRAAALRRAWGKADVSVHHGCLGFSELYNAAMERKGAAARWRKDKSFFDAMMAAGGLMVEATEGGARAMGLFSIGGNGMAYYEFAATTPHPPQGLADAVIAGAASYVNERHCYWLYLGGGVTADPNDSLLAYKKSFGGISLHAYMQTTIHNHGVYRDLCRDMGNSMSFFPGYRAAEAVATP